MTSENNPYHYCESCEAAREGAPVPYNDLDPEVVDLVRALNTVPGMRTLDSCFGHAGSGDSNKGTNNYAYVGLAPTGGSLKLFQHFWGDFYLENYGKIQLKTGWVQFSIVLFPFDPDPEPLIRLNIDTEHDASIDPRGNQEKKEAFLYLQEFIRQYLAAHSHLTRN